MTWDVECELKAWKLMRGYVHDKGKPPLEEQQEVANWLNQMLPYPSWRFEVHNSTKDFWVVTDGESEHISRYDTDGMCYGPSRYAPTATLMEMLTRLELNL